MGSGVKRTVAAILAAVTMLGSGAGIAGGLSSTIIADAYTTSSVMEDFYKSLPSKKPTVSVESITRTSAVIKCSGISGDYGQLNYNVYSDAALKNKVGTAIGNGRAYTSIEVKGLSPAKTYTYYVTAVSDNSMQKATSATAAVKFTTDGTYIQSCNLTNLKVKSVAETSVTLTWSKPAKAMTNFNYYLDAKGSYKGYVNGTTYQVTITGLKPNTKYTYGVRGWNKDTREMTSLESVTFTTKAQYAYAANAEKISKVIEYAKNSLGGSYAHCLTENAAKTKATATDCCGLTRLAYAKAGFNLDWSVYGQQTRGTGINFTQEIANGKQQVNYNALKAGDLIFFASYGKVGQAGSHVALYIGSGQIIHATCPSEGIKQGDLNHYLKYNYANQRVVAVRRLLNT